LGLLGLQAVGMLVFTTVQYGRFNLTNDFATYSQAWAAIAHGHLIPYSTLLREPFWRNDFELFMWPLALLYWLYPHAVTLLWLQALAVVGGELVVLSWAREALARASECRYGRARVLGLVAALLLATPWSWFTIGFDFHFEPFATLFALLAARDLWAGRHRRVLLWVALTLACCASAGSLYVIAVGLAGLATRNGPRRQALFVVLAGCAWLAFTAGIGAMDFKGQGLGPMYGYLSGGTTGHFGIPQLLEGLISHPFRALDVFWSHGANVAGYVASGGVIGLRSRWGILPVAFVLLPSALNAEPYFIHFAAAFQSWAAVLFLVVGTVFAIQRLSGTAEPFSRQGLALAICSVAAALGVAVVHFSQIPAYLQRVSPVAVATLSTVQERIASDAEVVASQGIIGRFSVGRAAYSYWPQGAPEQYPVPGDNEPIVFIFAPVEGTDDGDPMETRQAISYVKTQLHAHTVAERAGIWAFIWVPKEESTSVVLP
jgi:hypothetical protein